MLNTPTLVLDIETTGQPLENFDQTQQSYLFREADALQDEAERASRREQIQTWFPLWPLTGTIVTIGMTNPQTGRGAALYLAQDYQEEQILNGIKYIACSDEAEILEQFWNIASKYRRIVTFNGRNFDIPYLYLRSAILNVPITQKGWLGYRYSTEPHCDLLEQLTYYGAGGNAGACRKFNLDFYCKTFGITSPKEQGVCGYDVPRLIQEGQGLSVAEYCMRDVLATTELFRIWLERLAPQNQF